MKRMIIILMLVMLLVPTVCAWEWDNIKSYDTQTKEITITNALGLGGDLAKYKLTYNTDECLINCYAEGIAYLYDKQPLFSDMNIYKPGKVPADIPYKIYYKKYYTSKIRKARYKKTCNNIKDNVSCINLLDGYDLIDVPASKMIEYKVEDINGTI